MRLTAKILSSFVALSLFVFLFSSCEAPAGSCDPSVPAGSAGTCQSLTCTGALADCVNGAADGCETDTAADVNNCGGCGIKCPTPANGEAACNAGVCGAAACGGRYKDCNASATDGCEVDSSRDVNNCGECGNVCKDGPNGVGVCVLGKCRLACQGAYLDCNGNQVDGCETNGASDLANCGNCGNTCTAVGATNAACAVGSCISTMCTGTNRTCKAGPIDSCEVDTATSVGNCGACGKQCAAIANGTVACAASNCAVGSCNMSFGDCDKIVSNGCETNTSTTVSHCGGCGKACAALANATGACVGGACALGTCKANFADCDKSMANGCEVSTATDVNNCGMCGKVCAANEVCAGGVCASNCRTVGGVRWCYDPNNCGQGCNQVCMNLGLPFTIDNATWLAAQNTTAKCQAISDAFGLTGAISLGGYTYACAENQGPHTSPGGLANSTLYCSTDAGCPQQHRTNSDAFGVACGGGSFRSLCPCQ